VKTVGLELRESREALPRHASYLVDRALHAGARRFDANMEAFQRDLASGDVAAWSAFKASLALDIARYLAAVEPLIEDVYLCVSPEAAAAPMGLLVRTEGAEHSVLQTASALDRNLCRQLEGREIEPPGRLIDVRLEDDTTAQPGDAPAPAGSRRSVRVRIWTRAASRQDGHAA
jgi:hypothetical protein